ADRPRDRLLGGTVAPLALGRLELPPHRLDDRAATSCHPQHRDDRHHATRRLLRAVAPARRSPPGTVIVAGRTDQAAGDASRSPSPLVLVLGRDAGAVEGIAQMLLAGGVRVA